jgi:hypothetical protein
MISGSIAKKLDPHYGPVTMVICTSQNKFNKSDQ